MSRHMSKADEATSWRRTTALPADSQQHHSTSKGFSQQQQHHAAAPHHHHRAHSAEPTVAAHSRAHHHSIHQSLEPARPIPTAFSADEAQQLLEKRWEEVTAQGHLPTCQCSSSSKAGGDAAAAEAAADGQGGSSGSTAGGFLAALQAAVKVNSADAAWDD